MLKRYKNTFTLEEFRTRLRDTMWENLKKEFNYKLALKYGLISENDKPIKFYFEKGDIMNKKNSKISCRIKCQSYSDTPRNTTILVLIYAELFLFAIVVLWFSDVENAPLLLDYISTVVIALSALLLVPDTIENRRKETNDEARTFIFKNSRIPRLP